MKQFLKHVIAQGLGLRPAYKLFARSGLYVFLYHDVSDAPAPFVEEFGLNTPPEVFRWQIRELARDFDLVSIDDVRAKRIGRRSALITFDDGYSSNFTTVPGILRELDASALVFVNMEPIRGGLFWASLCAYLCNHDREFQAHFRALRGGEPSATDAISLDPGFVERHMASRVDRVELEELVRSYGPDFATEQQLRETGEGGVLHLGNHLYNHYNATVLSDMELRRMYEINRLALDQFDNARNVFSYPFGQPGLCYSPRTHEVLRQTSPELVFSAVGGINRLPGDFLHRYVPRASAGDATRLRGDIVWDTLRLWRRRKDGGAYVRPPVL